MHRSASTTRVSDEFYSASLPPMGRLSLPGGQRSLVEMDQLPKYNPQSQIAKREASRLRSAESAVHVIPVVLIVCALVLWFFSTPYIGTVTKDSPSQAAINNITNDAYSNGTVPSLGAEQGDLDSVEKLVLSKTNRRVPASEETD